MQLAGATRKGNAIWTLGVVCGHMASSDVHQGEAITVAIFHTRTGIQIKTFLFTWNRSVTDPKVELPFKSHLAKFLLSKLLAVFIAEQEKEEISDSWAKSSPLLQPAQLSMASGLIYIPAFVGSWWPCSLLHGPTAGWVWVCIICAELCAHLHTQQ